MRFIRRFFRSAYFLIPLVTLILSYCVWRYSPYLGTEGFRPFDSPTTRIVVIVVFWVLALLTMLTIFLVRRRKGRKIEKEIVQAVETETSGEDEIVKAELNELRDKLRGAMTKLRKSGGRKSLYELPWYVMIGPPGAGKTTAIVNSGLQFPLADEMGKSAIGGVGGTRNCDWWFTENAVLIDTAGRYTTQESDADADNAAWLGFLAMLKRNRTRQPINGAMIAISLSDLSLQDEATQKAHARAVRRRLHELREKLGVRFPVYVLFTKADLIAGFSEFFDTLGKEEREQVWGFTLPLQEKKAEASPIAAFDAEFGTLLTQLNAQLLEKMQTETDHQRRSLIAGFPTQVASLQTVARGFLTEVFQDTRYEERQNLRGVYFTSGTQEGTPIDRLMMGMARTFGIGRQAIGTGRGTGRSYFLTRLFENVIFPEAGLVSADDKVERRYRWSKRGAIAATILFAGAAGALWTQSYFANKKLMADVGEGLGQYLTLSAQIPGNPIGDTDLPGIVDALNALRDLPVNPVAARLDENIPDPSDPETRLTWGLYQGDIIANETGLTYRAALNQHLLPRALLRVEEQIQGAMNSPEALYEALKVYLMLGLRGPMDKDLIMIWMITDWEFAYPGAPREQMRADLAFHLDALLSQPMQEIALNGELVERAQDILVEMPLARRVYNGIINSTAAAQLPEFRPVEFGGPNIGRAMVRTSGKPMSEGIKGIYTYAGFNNVFLDEALGVAERVQSESWVLGPRGEAAQTEAAIATLSREVLDIYYTDFLEQYNTLLGDLDIVPMQSLSHAAEVTNILAGPTSPVSYVLTAVAEQTELTRVETIVDTGELTDRATDIGITEVIGGQSARTRLLLQALQASAQTEEGGPVQLEPDEFVEQRFAWLHQMVLRTEAQPSQLDTLLAALNSVYLELNRMSIRTGALDAGGGGEALLAFQEATSRLEGPLQRWASQITTGSSGITSEGTRAGIDARWKSQVLPFCEQAIAGRYPFTPNGTAEVGMQDFQRLFAPDGLINTFFNENLIQHVDTRTRPWTWNPTSTSDLGISDAVLAQFQAAADIREAFFGLGAAPAITFQITPFSIGDAEVSVLEIDGTQITYTQSTGQAAPSTISWPGSVGFARIGLSPPQQGVENDISIEGPWAMFKLLRAAQWRDGAASDRKTLIFSVGGRLASYRIQFGSVINPFELAALTTFSCPTSF